MCFFMIKYSIRMINSMDMKLKGKASVEFWVNYVISIFDLTHYLDHVFFKVKF